VKPRLAENGDDLYRKVKELSETGMAHEGRVLYPVFMMTGFGPVQIAGDGEVRVCENGGVCHREITKDELDELHKMIDGDFLVVALARPEGYRHHEWRMKVERVLHSPSGNAWKPTNKTGD